MVSLGRRLISQATTAGAKKCFYDFTVKDIDGSALKLDQFRGQVVVAVNVASKCGFTDVSYKQLSELLDRYYDQGLRVVLFPCNQFANQESGDACSIKSLGGSYNRRFIMTDKVDVNGANADPVWEWMKQEQKGFLFSAIKWNFTKVNAVFMALVLD